MTKKDKAQIIEALNQICAYVGAITCILSDEDAHSRDRPKGSATEGKQPEDTIPTEVPAAPTSGLNSTSEALDSEPAETTPKPAADTKSPETAIPEAEPVPEAVAEIKYEDVRAILAEKARTGYRAEVKALLTSHGIKQLSDANPAIYAQLLAEAEEIGNG